MMHFSIWLAALTAMAAPEPAPSLETLAWLSGRWRTDTEWLASGPVWTEEIWTDRATGVMLGLSRSRLRSGDGAFEYMRIGEENGTVSFYGSPGGAPPVAFRLVRATASEAVFENPTHDYPQRITYRLEGATLIATISKIDGSDPNSWIYRRQRPAE